MEPSRALYGAIFLRRGTGDADYIGLQQFRCFLRSFLGQPDGSFREEQGLYQRPAYKKEKPVEESGEEDKSSQIWIVMTCSLGQRIMGILRRFILDMSVL